MEALIGITGKDFVLVAADVVVARSIVVMKSGEDKSRDLNEHITMLFSGEAGDTVQFAEYIQRNVQLYGICNDLPMSPKAAASFTRRELADSLRSRKPYNVFLLIAGYSEKDGPELFWLDYLASVNKTAFSAHGYAAFFVNSLMDRHYHKNMSLDEAKELMKKCFRELKTRFIVNFPKFVVKVVDKDGIREIDLSI